jgi:hypothetical protein
METKGKIIEWRFSIMETFGAALSMASLAVGITLWSIATFQRKEDAIEIKIQLERRIDVIESEVRVMRASVEGVAKDVSYIRGRIEPKQ